MSGQPQRNFQMPTGPVHSCPTSGLPHLPQLMPLYPHSPLAHPEAASGANTWTRLFPIRSPGPTCCHPQGMTFLPSEVTSLVFSGGHCIVLPWPEVGSTFITASELPAAALGER